MPQPRVMTPLRKGMIGISVRVKEGLGSWLGGLGRVFSAKGREAAAEIGRKERPEPRTEAEEALWQAMGWDEPDGEAAVDVAVGKAAEVLR